MYRPSFAWNSIQSAARELKKGFGWQVDDGKSFNIKCDCWGFEGLDGNALVQGMEGCAVTSVRDLWIPNSRRWDKGRIQNLYG